MASPIKRPTTSRGRLLAIAGALAAAAVVAFAVVYFVFLPTSSPKPFTLSQATTAAAAPAGAAGTGAATGVTGAWNVAAGSQAGYRVREQLAFLPAQSDAVGRTSQITGHAQLAAAGGGARVSSASFVVAVNTLKSDRSMRDEKIHSIALESDRYPTATFVLSTPLTLPASALAGHVAHISAAGVLTIHGVSRTVTLPLEMSISGSQLAAAGSITFPWSEFGMTAPSIGGFVTVTEHATMEFDLRLQRV